ncbi:MAG TPA: hypothetical protein VFQ65_04575 [Kofleriaceae bacterium]|nr:hypothetical protein [Kofleriaceae bacterium]
MSHTPNPDDDTVIEVVPAPPPRRRPRTPNPAIDDVIHSGEIELPRSHIVRSSHSSATMPAAEREEDRTEPTFRPAPLPAAPVRSYGRLAFLVAAIAPAIAAIVLRVSQPAPPTAAATKSPEAEALAQLVATTLDGEAHAAQVRADAIASSTMLRAAIQTDAATIADMFKDQDVAVTLGKGERIEIFQARDGNSVSLFHYPTDSAPITAVPPGTARLQLDGTTVTVVVTTQVSKQGGGALGSIALAAPIDLPRAQGHGYEHLSGVALTGFAKPLALGGGAAAAKGTTISVPIVTSAAKGPALSITATLAAAQVTSNGRGVMYACYVCAALATLFLLLYVGSVILKR